METESNPELKHFYGQKLLQLLPFLGLGTVRWLSTLLPIISTHTQIPHCRQGNLSRGIEIWLGLLHQLRNKKLCYEIIVDFIAISNHFILLQTMCY